MAKCRDCGTELPGNAKFCSSCGAQVGLKKETFQVSSEKLVEKFKEVVKDARVKRVIIKDDMGKTLLSVPLTWGATGAVAMLALAPWLAAIVLSLVSRQSALSRLSEPNRPADCLWSQQERILPKLDG